MEAEADGCSLWVLGCTIDNCRLDSISDSQLKAIKATCSIDFVGFDYRYCALDHCRLQAERYDDFQAKYKRSKNTKDYTSLKAEGCKKRGSRLSACSVHAEGAAVWS